MTALERSREVELERLVDRCHPETCSQFFSDELDHTAHRLDRLGGGSGGHQHAAQVDMAVLDPAGVDLDYSARLRYHQLDPALSEGSQVPALAMEREPCDGMAGALHVGEERFADMAESDFLVVGEGLDCGVGPFAMAGPAPHQECQRGKFGVEVHVSRVTMGCRLVVAALIALLAGCADPVPPLPTVAQPEGGPSEAVAGNVVVRGDEATGCVWLELDGGGRMWPVWPAGFTSRWDPELTLLRPGGGVVASDGDRLDVGGGGVPATEADYPEACTGEDPDPLIWVVTSVSPAQ
jgi:hypothetical protein